MGLCKFCKCWVAQCGIFPAHCIDRVSESRLSCDVNTGFRPFTPKDGLKYSREYIIEKWVKHIAEEGAVND